MLNKSLLSIAVVTAALSLAACNDTETVVEPVEPAVTTEPVVEADPMGEPVVETDPMVDTMATQSIAELAAGNENLTILTAALQSAGLDSMLMSTDSKYTVFAPTDDAFAPVLEKLGVTKEELLANKELLNSVLPYHVVPMVVKADEIPYGTPITTANGATISISDTNVITDASGGTANITGTDIMATNGIVHTIDAVLMPK